MRPPDRRLGDQAEPQTLQPISTVDPLSIRTPVLWSIDFVSLTLASSFGMAFTCLRSRRTGEDARPRRPRALGDPCHAKPQATCRGGQVGVLTSRMRTPGKEVALSRYPPYDRVNSGSVIRR